MAKTNDLQLCQQYLMNYIETIQQELVYIERKLTEQVQLCPITATSWDGIDDQLEEFVERDRKYLVTRNNHQLKRWQDNLQKNQSFGLILNFYPTLDEVRTNRIDFLSIAIEVIIHVLGFRLRTNVFTNSSLYEKNKQKFGNNNYC